MFNQFKQFAMRKVVQSQLQKLPPEQAAVVEKLLEKDPELFMKIATEAQELMKQGKDQVIAMTTVAKKYEAEIKRLMSS